MKTFKLLSLLFATMLCIGFTSCSNDDDDNNDVTSIEGCWFYDGDDFEMELELYDSEFYLYEYYYGYGGEEYYGSYTYKNGVLKLTNQDGDRFTLYVISVTKNKLKIENEEGEIYTFIKDEDDD